MNISKSSSKLIIVNQSYINHYITFNLVGSLQQKIIVTQENWRIFLVDFKMHLKYYRKPITSNLFLWPNIEHNSL